MSTKHEVKSWVDYFEPIFTGAKTFELRIDDRKYHVGDTLLIREFDDKAGKYTGRVAWRGITYVLAGVGPGAITPLHGLNRGYVILSLKPID